MPFTPRLAALTFASGVASLIVWEVFARLIAPAWIGFMLDPTGLIEMASSISGAPSEAIHLVTGLLIFPLGFQLVVRPLTSGLSWPVQGAAYGIALWVFAMYVVASLFGGAPPFMGFAPVAWASLVGHLAVGLTITGVTALYPGASR